MLMKIDFVDGEYTINPETCIGCGICAEFCPADAVFEVEQNVKKSS